MAKKTNISKSWNPALGKNDMKFLEWYTKNTLEGQHKVPYDDKNSVYDFYSYYRNTPELELSNPEAHFPDTYKYPNHPTFSNESIYSTPEKPGGSWNGEEYNPKGKFIYATGGQMQKNTNSQFLPTYINGVPMYMCGGKMKYDLGGMMMPGAMLDMSQYQQQPATQPTQGGPDVMGLGSAAQQITSQFSGLSKQFEASRNNKPYAKESLVGAAARGGVSGGLFGAATGVLSAYMNNKAAKDAYQQQQEETLKQDLISNLPGQKNYIPTFADGGNVNNSFVINWLNNRKDILKNNLSETSLKNYVNSNPLAIDNRLDLYNNKIASAPESINPNLPPQVNGATITKDGKSRIEYPKIPLPQTRTHEQVHVAGITPDVSNTIKRITGLDYSKGSKLMDVQTPEELYPRLMEMRQVNQLDPTKQYSPEDVVKFRQVNTSGKKNALFDYFDDATISKLLNEVAMNNTDNTVNFAANGGELPITDRIANIDNGQTHEQSVIGGVPMGQNALTEVGEVVFKNKAGKKYVFTNRF